MLVSGRVFHQKIPWKPGLCAVLFGKVVGTHMEFELQTMRDGKFRGRWGVKKLGGFQPRWQDSNMACKVCFFLGDLDDMFGVWRALAKWTYEMFRLSLEPFWHIRNALGCGIFQYIIICRYIPYMYMVSHKRVRAPHLFSNMGTAMSNGHVDLARKLLHLRRVGSSSYVQWLEHRRFLRQTTF